MNNPKPIRKHSKSRRALMNAGYYTVKGLRLPVGLILVALASLATLPTLLCGLYAVGFWINYLRGNPQGHPSPGVAAISLSVPTLILLTAEYVLCRAISAYTNLPAGHFLNPLPPAPNGILPESQMLVRASAPADSATLLRAASGNQTDDAPTVLLRAVNSEPAE